jgi:hypothetical protein
MVLSPSRRDTCYREYNGVLLSAPTLFILTGYIPWQVQRRVLAFNEPYDVGDRHLEVMVRSPFHLGRSGATLAILTTSDEAGAPRTKRSYLERVGALSGELKTPQASLPHRARRSYLSCIRLIGGAGASFGFWAVLRSGLGHFPYRLSPLPLWPVVLFWTCRVSFYWFGWPLRPLIRIVWVPRI